MFREVKDFINLELLPKEPKNIEFEMEEESYSIVEHELEEEEPQTPVFRRLVQGRMQLERYSWFYLY